MTLLSQLRVALHRVSDEDAWAAANEVDGAARAKDRTAAAVDGVTRTHAEAAIVAQAAAALAHSVRMAGGSDGNAHNEGGAPGWPGFR